MTFRFPLTGDPWASPYTFEGTVEEILFSFLSIGLYTHPPCKDPR